MMCRTILTNNNRDNGRAGVAMDEGPAGRRDTVEAGQVGRTPLRPLECRLVWLFGS